MKKNKPSYGGSLVKGKRKTTRPLCCKRLHHFVLKSKRRDLYQYRVLFERELHRWAKKFHLRVYDIAVNHTHIHFTLYIPEKGNYLAFIRSFTGLLARKLGKGLWSLLPFSRILSWGRDYERTKKYLQKNREQAQEKHFLEQVNQILSSS